MTAAVSLGTDVFAVVPAASEMIQSRAMTWLTWAMLAVAVLFLGLHLFGDHDLGVGRGMDVSTQQ